MANTVTMYITSLNRENRMINSTYLSTYLSSCTKVSLNTTYPIMPNVPFYIDISDYSISNIYLYNYLQYTYGSKTYYSFIDNIDFMANEGVVQISHTVDYIIASDIFSNSKPLLNSNISGTVTRGLLDCYGNSNSSSSTYTPYFVHSMNTPEFEFSSSGLSYFKYRPNFKGVIASDYDQYWLYIYVANPLTILNYGNVYPQQSMNGIPNLGLTFCYPIVNDGFYWQIISMEENSTLVTSTSLNAITNENITSMLISPIPPINSSSAYAKYSTGTESAYIPATGIRRATFLNNDGSLPQYANWYEEYQGIDITTSNLYTSYDSGVSFASNEASFLRYPKSSTFTSGNYTVTQPKSLSYVYNPMYIEDTPIIYNQAANFATKIMTVYISADLTSYGYQINLSQSSGNAQLFRKQITSSFSPTVLLDYWTRLNASIESINAQGTKVKSIVNGVSSVINMGSSIASPISSTYLSNMGKTMSTATIKAGLQGMYNAESAGVRSGLGAASTIVDSYYNYQIADRQQEIADYQYTTGLTDETGAMYLSGIFGFSDLPTVYTVQQSDNNRFMIGYNLGFYGESCNMDYLIYTTLPQRKYFEYLQIKDFSCLGLPTYMIMALREIFAKGVRLWYTEPDLSVNVDNYYSNSVVS